MTDQKPQPRSGICQLRNTINGKLYIGKSTNIEKRIKLPIAEQKWIDSVPVHLLYNLVVYVIDKHNESNPFFGRKHTEHTKEMMSSAKSGRYLGSENPNFGNAWDEQQRSRMRGEKNANAKLTSEQVIEIKRMLGEGKTHQVIANIFGIGRATVTKINIGTRWSHIVDSNRTGV